MFVIVDVDTDRLDARALEYIGPSTFDSDLIQVRCYHNDGVEYVGNVPASNVYGEFATAAEAEVVIAQAAAALDEHNASVKAVEEEARIARLAVKAARDAREKAWHAVLAGSD